MKTIKIPTELEEVPMGKLIILLGQLTEERGRVEYAIENYFDLVKHINKDRIKKSKKSKNKKSKKTKKSQKLDLIEFKDATKADITDADDLKAMAEQLAGQF